MFCKHRWVIVSKQYTQPHAEIKSITNTSSRLAQELFFGFTTVEQRCLKCGLSRFDKLLGKVLDGNDL